MKKNWTFIKHSLEISQINNIYCFMNIIFEPLHDLIKTSSSMKTTSERISFENSINDLTKKIQLLARYDDFTPNCNNTSYRTKEYSAGINYFIKGQALKLILNYVYRQDSLHGDSHRIILGTQIVL